MFSPFQGRFRRFNYSPFRSPPFFVPRVLPLFLRASSSPPRFFMSKESSSSPFDRLSTLSPFALRRLSPPVRVYSSLMPPFVSTPLGFPGFFLKRNRHAQPFLIDCCPPPSITVLIPFFLFSPLIVFFPTPLPSLCAGPLHLPPPACQTFLFPPSPRDYFFFLQFSFPPFSIPCFFNFGSLHR